MVNTYTNVEVTISGISDEDVRNQAKEHFGFEDQKVPEPRKPQYCETGKLNLVKFLRDFERKFYGEYNPDNGEYDKVRTGLIELKKFVEEKFGV